MLEDKKPQLTPISELGEFGLIKHLTENFPIKNSSTERSIGVPGFQVRETILT